MHKAERLRQRCRDGAELRRHFRHQERRHAGAFAMIVLLTKNRPAGSFRIERQRSRSAGPQGGIHRRGHPPAEGRRVDLQLLLHARGDSPESVF
eukprot:scaffold301_cov243-Pinguiococcus_pyrenoidosus.AAC.166